MACWICGCIRRRSDSDEEDSDVLDDGDDVRFVDRMVVVLIVSLTLVLSDVCVCDVDGSR